MKKKEPKRVDKRTIAKLFRAVERDKNYPTIVHGILLADDGFNFVCFGTVESDVSHLRERVFPKNDFSFSKISFEEYRLNAITALQVMEREKTDASFTLDAAEYKFAHATKLHNELTRSLE